MAAEVLNALRAALPGQNDPAIAAECEGICDMCIWPVRGRRQIATAKMSRYAASKITKVSDGPCVECVPGPVHLRGASGDRPSATVPETAPRLTGPAHARSVVTRVTT